MAIDRRGSLKAAPTTHVDELRPVVDELVQLLGELCDVKSLWVSDGSRLRDFGVSAADVEVLRERLGVEVEPGMFLWELAQRVSTARRAR